MGLVWLPVVSVSKVSFDPKTWPFLITLLLSQTKRFVSGRLILYCIPSQRQIQRFTSNFALCPDMQALYLLSDGLNLVGFWLLAQMTLLP